MPDLKWPDEQVNILNEVLAGMAVVAGGLIVLYMLTTIYWFGFSQGESEAAGKIKKFTVHHFPNPKPKDPTGRDGAA